MITTLRRWLARYRRNQAAAGADVFISYSHTDDRALAPHVQHGLARLGKRWNRPHALRVFRDQTDLHASPDLWSEIEQALAGATYLLLLASPGAAESEWVGREIDYWRTHKPRRNLLVAVTGGDVRWAPTSRDFDWGVTSALPRALSGYFTEGEPLWVDLRQNTYVEPNLRDPQFADAIATVAAPVHGMTKAELIGEDIRRHRRFTRIRNGAIAALVLLVVLALIAATIATRQTWLATERERIATSRALAARADSLVATSPRLATHLALYAFDLLPTPEAKSALASAAEANTHTVGYLGPRSEVPAAFRATSRYATNEVAVSGDGNTFALFSQFDQAGQAEGEETKTVRVFATADRRLLATIQAEPNNDLAIDHLGRRLVAGGRVWDIGTQKPIARVADRGGRWPDAAISPDGRWVATKWRTDEGPALVRIVAADTGREAGSWTTAGPNPGIRFSADSTRVHVVDAEDGASSHRVFDLRTEATAADVPLPNMPTGFAFPSATGAHALVLSGREIQMWDLGARDVSARRAIGENTAANSVSMSADGARVFIGTAAAELTVYDGALDPVVNWRNPYFPRNITLAVMTPDGSRVISAAEDGSVVVNSVAPVGAVTEVDRGVRTQVTGDGRASITSDGHTVRIRDVPSGQIKATLPASVLPERAEFAVDVTNDFSRVAILYDGMLWIRDVVSSAVVSSLPVARSSPGGGRVPGPEVHFLDGADRVLVTSEDNPALVVDTRTGREAQSIGVDGDASQKVLLAEDRATIAQFVSVASRAGVTDIEVRLWRWDRVSLRFATYRTARFTADFFLGGGMRFEWLGFAVAANLDSVAVVDGDGRIHIADMVEPTATVLDGGLSSTSTNIAFGANDTILVQDGNLGADSVLYLWDVKDRVPLGQWRFGHAGQFTTELRSLARLADGDLLGTQRGAGFQRVLSWRLGFPRWRQLLCATIANDELSASERRRYLPTVKLPNPCYGQRPQ
ncbi:toll/interleukin-1 receptor domain-containing protein [Nocardia sp. MW-W600-9]